MISNPHQPALVNIMNTLEDGEESTFVGHTNFAGFGYDFRDIFRFLDRARDQLLKLHHRNQH